MFVYADLELSNDIKKVKNMINKCSNACKNIEKRISIINKTYSPRFYFISSQFKIYSKNYNDNYIGK